MNIWQKLKGLVEGTGTTSFEEIEAALDAISKEKVLIGDKKEKIKILSVEKIHSVFSVSFVVDDGNPNVQYGPGNQITYIGSGPFSPEYKLHLSANVSVEENIQVFKTLLKNLKDIFV